MWHVSIRNKHGDFYHEQFKSLGLVWAFIDEKIGEDNVTRMRCRWVPA